MSSYPFSQGFWSKQRGMEFPPGKLFELFVRRWEPELDSTGEQVGGVLGNSNCFAYQDEANATKLFSVFIGESEKV